MSTSIEEVKRRHTDQFMAMPDVVSVGIGKNAEGEQAIVVGLGVDNHESRSTIPESLEGYPVEVRIIGPVRAR